MKAFISGAVVSVILAVAAAVVMQNANMTADMAYTTSSARVSQTN